MPEQYKKKILAGAYDVVLMDIQMPVMDGDRVMATLREGDDTKPLSRVSLINTIPDVITVAT